MAPMFTSSGLRRRWCVSRLRQRCCKTQKSV